MEGTEFLNSPAANLDKLLGSLKSVHGADTDIGMSAVGTDEEPNLMARPDFPTHEVPMEYPDEWYPRHPEVPISKAPPKARPDFPTHDRPPEEMWSRPTHELIPDELYWGLSKASANAPAPVSVTKRETFSGDVYHIILDCDFSMRNELWNNINKSSNMGSVRNLTTMDSRIPVLFNLDDVEKISKRLVYVVTQKGSLGNKKYPIFGAVAVRLKLDDVSTAHADVLKTGNTKDYSKVESATEDLVTYTSAGRSNGYKRGVLSVNALHSAKVVGYKYISTIEIQEQIGFGLLNLYLKSGDDVRELKKLYDESKKDLKEFDTQPQAGILSSTGGSSVDYENLYRQEKRRYLQLKEIAAKMGINQ